MNKTNWIKRFEPLNRAKLIEATLQSTIKPIDRVGIGLYDYPCLAFDHKLYSEYKEKVLE